MASLAVSRDWWSYRNSLSKKSRASGLTRCWFSLWTKRSHRLRECLQEKRPKSGQAGDSDAKTHFLKEQELWQISSPEGGCSSVQQPRDWDIPEQEAVPLCLHAVAQQSQPQHSHLGHHSPCMALPRPQTAAGLMFRMDYRPKIAGSALLLCI